MILGEKMVLSDSMSDLSRLLVRRWFFQTNDMFCQNSWWEDGSFRLTVCHVKTLGEKKMVLSDSLSDLMRPLVRRWFFQTNSLFSQDSWWEVGSFRLTVCLVTTLCENMVLLDLRSFLSRLLVWRWFFQTHCMSYQDYWWEGGSSRLTVCLLKTLDGKVVLSDYCLSQGLSSQCSWWEPSTHQGSRQVSKCERTTFPSRVLRRLDKSDLEEPSSPQVSWQDTSWIWKNHFLITYRDKSDSESEWTIFLRRQTVGLKGPSPHQGSRQVRQWVWMNHFHTNSVEKANRGPIRTIISPRVSTS